METRSDLQAYIRELTEPLLPCFSPGRARVRLGATVAIHDDTAAELESFARPLWGLAPLAVGGGDFPHWEYWVRGLASGTDPDHPEYWGEPRDHDQRIVEMAAIGFALALAPERLWDPLTGAERDRVVTWLSSALPRETTENNWLFFPVLISLGLERLGVAYDKDVVSGRLDLLETFALGDGWYADGKTERRDYYVPWAMHMYGLIYAALAGDRDPERAERFRERASLFAHDFLHWFADDGAAVPYGRSLTYRFAQSAFWAALPFAGVEALPWGVVKGQWLRNLRWWEGQSLARTSQGLLSVGYSYPQPALAEQYNAPGSPYWALKALLPLALDESHPFWTAAELPAPQLPDVHAQPHSGAVLMRAYGDVTALTGRQHHAWVRHGAEKYAKFAYSSRFGFSLPAGPVGLEQGAYDSMLALSEDGIHWRVREQPLDAVVDGDCVRATWKPWDDVEVTTWLSAAPPWQLRRHHIRTARRLHTAEGAFAVDRDAELRRVEGAGMALAEGPAGLSGLTDPDGSRTGQVVEPMPGTNVLARRTALPTLLGELEPGEHWLRCAVLGGPAGPETAAAWGSPPECLRTSTGGETP